MIRLGLWLCSLKKLALTGFCQFPEEVSKISNPKAHAAGRREHQQTPAMGPTVALDIVVKHPTLYGPTWPYVARCWKEDLQTLRWELSDGLRRLCTSAELFVQRWLLGLWGLRLSKLDSFGLVAPCRCSQGSHHHLRWYWSPHLLSAFFRWSLQSPLPRQTAPACCLRWRWRASLNLSPKISKDHLAYQELSIQGLPASSASVSSSSSSSSSSCPRASSRPEHAKLMPQFMLIVAWNKRNSSWRIIDILKPRVSRAFRVKNKSRIITEKKQMTSNHICHENKTYNLYQNISWDCHLAAHRPGKCAASQGLGTKMTSLNSCFFKVNLSKPGDHLCPPRWLQCLRQLPPTSSVMISHINFGAALRRLCSRRSRVGRRGCGRGHGYLPNAWPESKNGCNKWNPSCCSRNSLNSQNVFPSNACIVGNFLNM